MDKNLGFDVGQEMLYFSKVKTGRNYWCDLAQPCSELRIMLAGDCVKMTGLTDRLNVTLGTVIKKVESI